MDRIRLGLTLLAANQQYLVTLGPAPTVSTLADAEEGVNGVTLGEDGAVYYNDQTGGHVYLDYFTAVADAQGSLKVDLNDDGLHPNAAGYGVMAPLAEKAIAQALAGRR